MLVQLAVYDVGTRHKLLDVRIHADERVTMRVGGTPQEYLLLAAVEHVGNFLNGGHYVCYRRVDADGSWLVLNDDGATRIGLRHGSRLSAEEFRERQLYLCMYARAASGEGLPPVVSGHQGGHVRGAGTVSDQPIIDADSALAESEVALVAAAKRLSLESDECRVTATVSRAGVVNPTSSARRSPPRRPLRRHQHHEARLLRRSGAMTGDDELDLFVNFSEMERLRHFGSERDVVGLRGRELQRRVGQQLETARPLRRSLTTAGGDDDLELSRNVRRLDLGGAEEDVVRTVQGSASISSSSAAGLLGVVDLSLIHI